MESSFLELRCKEVINIVDGKLLGHIIDMVVDLKTSCVKGLVIPMSKGMFSFFKQQQEIFIPYKNICKIGEDVILVELYNLPQVKKSKKVNALKVNDTKQEREENQLEPITPNEVESKNLKSKLDKQNFDL